MRLIPEWKESWKFASIQWNALGALFLALVEAANASWVTLPHAFQRQIPYAKRIALVIFVLALLGRLLVGKTNEKYINKG